MVDLTANVDAERAVIATVLGWPGDFDKIASELTSADFYNAGHAAIWHAMSDLVVSGEPITVPLLRARIADEHDNTLTLCLAEGIATGGAAAHVREVKRCATIRRQLAELGDIAEDIRAGRGADRAQRLLQLEDERRTEEKYLTGRQFVFADRVTTRAVWGQDSSILWAGGEPFYIVGPTGVGKTTIAHQLVLARMGLLDDVLGFPVALHHGRVLYIAADRPNQIRNAFRRLFDEDEHGKVMDDELVVWEGRPPVDFATQPEGLYAMARAVKADTVVIDSVKDVVANINEPAQGQAFNTALQVCVANGVETLCLHHTRKKQQGVKQGIDDLYGGWLAAGAGSIIALKGEAGGAEVELVHWKQPVDDVGPLKVIHDHDAGRSRVERGGIDVLRVLEKSPGGMSAKDLAILNYETQNPNRNQVENMRKQCDRKVRTGLLVRLDRNGEVRYAVAVPDE